MQGSSGWAWLVGLVGSRWVRRAALLLLLGLVLVVVGPAWGSGPTDVSGTISVDTTWTAANSPYVMTSNVTVQAGVTLTVQPGVVVEGSSGATLSVNGTLSAVGTASAGITFTSTSDSGAGQWPGITFGQNSQGSVLQYVTVRYGGQGSAGASNGEITLYSGSSLTIDDSTVSDSLVSGVSAASATVTVARSKFVRNGVAGSVGGHGMFTNLSQVTITDSAFWSNKNNGLRYQTGSTYTFGPSTVTGTSFWGNGQSGINMLDAGATTLGLVGHVAGAAPNEIYDNGTFGFSQQEDWVQLYVSSASPTVDWSGTYWGPVTYQPCGLGDQLGHLSYGAPDPNPSTVIPVDRGPVSHAVSLQGQSWCGNDNVIVNAPRQTWPDLYFNPPPPSFGGLIPQALWNCKACLQHFPELAASLDANSPTPTKNVGDPVNTATGDFLENATDLRLAGPGIPFAWMRSYNSADTGTSGLGIGWTDMFEAKLSGGLASAANVTYRAGSGQQTVFTNASGTSSGAATYLAKGFDGTFKRLSDGSFSMVTRDQRTFTFNSAGELTSIKPRFGPATILAYTSGQLSSITDGAGRTITITYTVGTPSLIAAVTLPDGRSVQYGYTGDLLTSVTDARGKTTTLAYDASNRLVSIKDPSGNYLVQNIAYDGQGRVTSEQDGAGDATTYAYSNDGTYDVTTVTLPGHTGSWVYKQLDNEVDSVTDPLGHTTSYTYDAMGRTATVTDPRGNTTSYLYDHSGNVVETIAPASLGYTTSATYNATNDPLTQTDGRGHTTTYTYATSSDPAADYQVGQLKSVTDRADGVTTYKYLTASSSPAPPAADVGLVKSMTDQRGKTWSYGYDASGDLTSITSPLGNKTTLGYDGSGRLTSRRDPRGNAVNPPSGYLTQWAYNNDDQVTTLTDARGNATNYDYYDNGQLEDIVRTDRNDTPRTTTFTYDANNQLATTTDPRNGVESRSYWPDGSLKQVTSPAGRITSYAYDDAGELTSVVEPNGNAAGGTPSDYTTTYTYDASGNQISAQHPDGGTTQIAYDALNRPTQWTDANNHTTTVAYDANGNITQRTDALNHTTSYAYDNLDRLTSVTNPLDKTTSYTYFPTGQLESVTTPLGNETSYGLDDDGRVTSMVEPRGNAPGGNPADYTWTYGYDQAGNRTSVTDPLGDQTSYGYDELNNLTQITDPNHNTTTFSYDPLNRLWTVTPPAAGNTGTLDTVYSYDPDGNLASRTDPNGNTVTYGYDLDGLLTQKTTPVGTWNYGYDANGNLTSLQTPAGPTNGTISYGYDRMSRLTSVSYSDGTASVSRSYDPAGRLTGMTDAAGSLAYSYDNADRLTDITRTGGGGGLDGTLHYDYDAAGQITGRTYPDGTAITASYTADGQLASLTDSGQTTSFSYDPAGNLTATTNPTGNGYSENRTYDRAGRLVTVDNTKAGTSLSKFSWTLDAAGNPTIVDTLRGGTDAYDGYQYDARNRLTTACYDIASTATDCSGASNTIAYSYDKVDNLSQQTRSGSVSNPGTITYAYNTADQLTSTTEGSTVTNYSYDPNGNETSDGTNIFTYNLANQLTSSTTAGLTTSYSYDGNGNRITSNTPGGPDLNYTWDPQAPSGLPELILEQTSSGSLVRRYLDGPNGALSMTTSADTYHYAHDPLGSVTDVTDSTGTPQWTYSYEPYGATRTTTNVSGNAPDNPLQYDGQYLDAQTNTYNLRAREYDPTSARFGALDPVTQATTDPAVGAYVYVDASPTLGTDPLGLCWPKSLCGYENAVGSTVSAGWTATTTAVSSAVSTTSHAFSRVADAAGNAAVKATGAAIHATSAAIGWASHHPIEALTAATLVAGTAVCIVVEPCGLVEATAAVGDEAANIVANEAAIEECTVAETSDTVSLFKAPQPGLGASQYENGYLATDFPGSPGQIPDGNAYFARSQSIADEFAQSYGEGVIETRVPADVYAERYAQYERLYQGGPRVEVPIPANEVESLNEFPRIWHR